MQKIISFLLLGFSCVGVYAEEKLQDMSDPLAVYTQAGAGVSNRGINIKVGKSYDPKVPDTMAMNVLEIKGIYGDTFGWDEGVNIDNSVDSIRFRNFKVDLTTGRGTQIDVNFGFDKTNIAEQAGDISYSLMQALPKMSIFSLYPLAGVGAAFGNNVVEDDNTIDSGYSVYGTFVLVGMFSKIAITDKVWLNYNPFYLSTLSGSNNYKDNAYGIGNDSILLHEFAASYQINPRLNIRYFANWNENVNFSDGDHRLEFNYQL